MQQKEKAPEGLDLKTMLRKILSLILSLGKIYTAIA